MKITVETTVAAPLEEVWRAWTSPADILQWNAASDDWHTTDAKLDLRVGGAFSSHMEARDGSAGFDFAGTFTRITQGENIEYSMEDGRAVQIEFIGEKTVVRIRETFDAESTCPLEHQRAGWQAILDRFARHVEGAQ